MYNELGLAAYPIEFKEIVISPNKLCLQFSSVTTKVRLLGKDGKQLPKDPITHQPVASISTDDKSVFNLLAVGCQLPVVFNLLHNIIVSFDKYGQKYSKHFSITYGKDFKEEIRKLRKELEILEKGL